MNTSREHRAPAFRTISQPASLSKAHVAAIADDDVVEDVHADQLSDVDQPLCERHVGGWIAAWVIVRHDDRGGIRHERSLEDLARVDQRGVERAAAHLVIGDHSMLPTETILSHDSSKSNPHTLRRWHAKIEALTGVHMPTAEEEARDPYAARQAAEAATTWLRVRAKADRKKYHLVFSTNCDFGFCRNTCGMKWIGLLIASGVTAVLTAKLYMDMSSHAPVSEASLGVVVVTSLLLCFWVWVNRSWVRQAGERYAHALLETLDM